MKKYFFSLVLTLASPWTHASVNLDQLPAAQAIQIIRGDGSRKLVIFSDPHCFYCKKLDAEVARLNNVTIHIYPVPLIDPSPTAIALDTQIWCNRNAGQTWHDFVLGGIQPAAVTPCPTPFSKNLSLLKQVGVNAVPLFILPNQSVHVGFSHTAELDALLDQATLESSQRKKP